MVNVSDALNCVVTYYHQLRSCTVYSTGHWDEILKVTYEHS
jgi:hypothetical protein